LAATDTFCSKERPEKKQIDQYRELFYSLIGETEEASKRLIANALAKHYYTPRQVLLYLALETAAIAAPILAYAKGLSPFDLKQVISKTSNLHHRIIASRDDLDSTIVDRLVELNDHLVLRRLQDNSTLDISQQLVATTTLSDLVEPEETPVIVSGLDITATQELNRENISEKKTEYKVKSALDELVALANRGQRLGKATSHARGKPADERTTFKEVLLESTIRKSRQDQSIAIQQRFNLSAKTVHAIFEDHSGDSLAVTLKAAELPNDAALQIITQSLPNVGLSDHNIRRMSKIYPALDQKICNATVGKWSEIKSQLPPTYRPASMDTSMAERPVFGKRAPIKQNTTARKNLRANGS
jgi:uncharacterized protein (DUF2336 family)